MRRRIRMILGSALVAGSLLLSPTTAAQAGSSSSAAAAPKPKFQLPFKCGTEWQLNTYADSSDPEDDHNPALDIVVKGNTGSRGMVVRASYAGVVRVAKWDAGAGNVIQIDHGNGWWTAYYHLLDSPTTYVSVGQRVNMWTQIGRVGESGSNGGGWEHLHYEQRFTSNLNATSTSQSQRVAVHFNTRSFTGANKQWNAVVSHNCTHDRPTRFCQYRVKNTPWGSIAKRSFSGTKYDTEGRIADGTLVSAGLDGTREGGAWRRLRMSGGSDNRGPWVSSAWLQYVGGSGCPI